jgi:hypothetical protein
MTAHAKLINDKFETSGLPHWLQERRLDMALQARLARPPLGLSNPAYSILPTMDAKHRILLQGETPKAAEMQRILRALATKPWRKILCLLGIHCR